MTEKAEIRKLIKEKRKNLTTAEVKEKSKAAEGAFLESDIYKNAATIMLYMPIQNEADITGIKDKALSDGKRLVFPVTERGSGRITSYFAHSKTEFVKGNFSVPEPVEAESAEPDDIDAILVPGIAFDCFGNRIGFGKGCYDSFLSKSSAVKIGVCYEFQLCDKIFAEAYDIKMDYILTENGLRKCGQTAGE